MRHARNHAQIGANALDAMPGEAVFLAERGQWRGPLEHAARGIAKCLGFELALNFNLPYFAANPKLRGRAL